MHCQCVESPLIINLSPLLLHGRHETAEEGNDDGKEKRAHSAGRDYCLGDPGGATCQVTLRFKTVCKAWQAIISDPAFIRAQLRCSASRWEQDPTFIISPNILNTEIPLELWPPACINHLRFYQWKQGASMAEYLHDKDFDWEYSGVLKLAHCDGLVLAATDTKLCVSNPATRDVIMLPDSNRNNLSSSSDCCNCTGLCLDRNTGEYKVVHQAFYRPEHYFRTDIPDMGMKAFTVVGGKSRGVWREIRDELPYPVKRYQTGLSINGFLFWHIDKSHFKEKQPPRGIICLDLKEEEFSVIRLPDSLDPALDDAFRLDVLHGRELCLAARTISETTPAATTIWTMSIDEGLNWQWERRYSIHVSGPFRPLAIPPGSTSIILWKGATTLCRYELTTSELTTLCEMDRMRYQGRRERKWDNLLFFNVRPYTASLVQLTRETFLRSKETVLNILLPGLQRCDWRRN